MDVLTVNSTGMNALLHTLNELPFEMRRELEPAALRAMGNVIKKLAQGKAPVGNPTDYWYDHTPGGLRRNIAVRIKKARSNLDETEGFVYVKRDAFYAHMVEFGHWILTPRKRRHKETVRAKRENARVRFVAPRPFMRPAVDEGRVPGFVAAGRVAEKKLPGVLRKVVA